MTPKIVAGDKVIDNSRVIHKVGVVIHGIRAFDVDAEEGIEDARVQFSKADFQWFKKDQLEWNAIEEHWVVKS